MSVTAQSFARHCRERGEPIPSVSCASPGRADSACIEPTRATIAPFPKPQAAAGLVQGAARDSPPVRLLDEILCAAAARRASDVHFEHGEQHWRVRFRIDGMLHEYARLPLHLYEAVITRIKVLARLDISQQRLPQDGRLTLGLARGYGTARRDDFRVSTLPTIHGEKLVLRRLDSLPEHMTLEGLGLSPAQRQLIESTLRVPHGVILVTGPTGSGKSRSLCCFLQQLDPLTRNICTVEDPVEIPLPEVNQVSVNEKAGLSFSSVLRAFLRQDPDVMMIGEIRDAQTADVALKAAQTGHLVLSTLHTNDAPSALARLVDIGIAPYKLASAVRLITAQRLVRKLCPACRAPRPLDTAARRALGLTGDFPLFRARGCAHCHGIGFSGRVGIHQVMPILPSIHDAILGGASVRTLAELARAEGVPTLRDSALEAVRAGLTTLEEAFAASEPDHDLDSEAHIDARHTPDIDGEFDRKPSAKAVSTAEGARLACVAR